MKGEKKLKEGYGLCPLMTTVVIKSHRLDSWSCWGMFTEGSFAGVCKSTCGVKNMNRGCILMFPSCYVSVYGNKPHLQRENFFFFFKNKSGLGRMMVNLKWGTKFFSIHKRSINLKGVK